MIPPVFPIDRPEPSLPDVMPSQATRDASPEPALWRRLLKGVIDWLRGAFWLLFWSTLGMVVLFRFKTLVLSLFESGGSP